MRIQVELTKRDIETGWPRSCAFCPVVLAVNRAVKDLGYNVLTTTCGDIHFYRNEIAISRPIFSCRTPPQAETFIREFDQLHYEGQQPPASLTNIQPFTFEITIPTLAQ